MVVNARLNGITYRVSLEIPAQEGPRLGQLPDRNLMDPYPREDRTVAWDGYVSWEGSRYGVPGSGQVPRSRRDSSRAPWISGAVAVQVPCSDLERFPLVVYDLVPAGGVR